jgi:protein-tyrosine kinase
MSDLTTPADKSIGQIIRDNKNLSFEQVEQILAFQKQHKVKFGEAAVALGFAKREDVLWALSQQFEYPYTQGDKPVLSPELIVANDPFSKVAELFRSLRTHLIEQLLEGGNKRMPIAVVSPASGDGKSFFSANLAVAFSQLGKRTLLIDANMRTPRQQEIFKVAPASGLSSVLAGRGAIDVMRPTSDLPNLYVLPVGTTPPNPLELCQSNILPRLLREMMNTFEYVIVDTPGADLGTDSRVIAAACGAALALGRKHATSLSDLKDLVESLPASQVTFAGVVFNEH